MSDVARAPRIVLSWWRLQGSQYVVRIRWLVHGVAATLRRQIPHGSGLLGEVLSVCLASHSAWDSI